MSRLDRITCEEAFRRIDEFLDRELSPPEMKLVQEHLDTCEACTREFRFEASVIHTVRAKLKRIAVPPDLVDRITRKLAADTDSDSPG